MTKNIPREFIDQVLSKINIVDIIDSYVTLKKFGSNYKACCPFHDEKSPSFVVSPAKQIYHCFGCGVGGNAISFMMEHDHMSFVDAISELAHRAHLSIPVSANLVAPAKPQQQLYDLMQEATQFYELQLRQTERPKTYVIQRGLSGGIAKQFALGYAPSAWDKLLQHLRYKKFSIDDMSTAGLVSQKEQNKAYDKFRDRIMFPIHDRQGRIIAFGGRVLDQGEPKYLNSPETPIFHKGNELYGLYQWLKSQRRDDSVIVVEGYMDVLALVQQGLTNVVGTLGTATTEQHLQLLCRYTDKIVFCFDGDNAGKKAAWRALTVALPKLKSNKTLSFMFLPDGEDPDTYVRQQGKVGFEHSMRQAITLSEFFVQHLAQDLNLNIADHRAKFLHHANQLLQTMTDVELQRILAQEVAQRIRLPVAEVLSMIKQPVIETKVVSRWSHAAMPSNLRKVMAIIVQYPQHALTIVGLVNELSAQYAFLKQVVCLIQENSVLTTSSLLEYFRDSEQWAELLALSSRPLLIAEEGLVRELQDAVQKIVAEERRQEMDALIAKAQKVPLSDAEKQQLHLWLKAR